MSEVMGGWGLWVIGGYCVVLLGIGWLGARAKKEESLADFYLGGRGFGVLVLFLTLYATQYSGNTMLGFVGKAYRSGFPFVSGVGAMMAIVGGYLVFAPELQRLSKKRGYVTLGDYMLDRFRSRGLAVFATLIGVFGLGNFLVTNLKVVGELVEVMGDGKVGFAWGVIGLATVMVVYEWMGGMRSVAWTDVLQGVMLLFGVVAVFVALEVFYGGLAGVEKEMVAARPEIMAAPDWGAKVKWLSTLVLFFFGISMYPHAIQRIYAARSGRVLKRSLQVMVFMPLVTTLLMVVLGLTGIGVFPGLDKVESDRVTLMMLGALVEQSPVMGVIVVMFVGAVLAATMSTIDSALLSISSMVTKDLYGAARPALADAVLARAGKWMAVGVMAVAVGATLALREKTIWGLLEIKLEVLCQLAPAVMLGVHWKGLRGQPVLWGMVSGTVAAVAIRYGWETAPLGVHAGLWGLGVNVLVVGGMQRLRGAV